MLYGLTGSAGTGKTTLARAVAESLGITFQPTSITESAKKHGFNAVGVLSLRERLALQEHLLTDLVEMLDKAPRPLIVDRTPIDLIGYMFAELDMHSHLRSTQEELAQIEDYRHRCLQAAVRRFDHIFVLRPLPVYEEAETRPTDNRPYQSHTQMLMEGALYGVCHQVSSSVIFSTDFATREGAVHDRIVARLNAIEQLKTKSPHVH